VSTIALPVAPHLLIKKAKALRLDQPIGENAPRLGSSLES